MTIERQTPAQRREGFLHRAAMAELFAAKPMAEDERHVWLRMAESWRQLADYYGAELCPDGPQEVVSPFLNAPSRG